MSFLSSWDQYMIDDLNHDYSILEIINKESDELLLETINE